jgi:TetR/AcrR family transcriptional regulator, regulator of biofilm formation and stress response
VTNRNVARAARVFLGSLTYYFESQTELLRETLLCFVAAEARRLHGVAAGLRSAETGPDETAAAVQEILSRD